MPRSLRDAANAQQSLAPLTWITSRRCKCKTISYITYDPEILISLWLRIRVSNSAEALIENNTQPYHSPGASLLLCSRAPCRSRPQVRSQAMSSSPTFCTASLSRLVALLSSSTSTHRPALALSGAGISTSSGLPDYRSPRPASSPRPSPMLHQTFISSASARARYWARSHAGHARLRAALPNPAHLALAALHAHVESPFAAHITQNVDSILLKAGFDKDDPGYVELHGALRDVKCTECGVVMSRDKFQDRLSAANPSFSVVAGSTPAVRPDGDTEVDTKGFVVPSCGECGGDLAPDIVFMGGAVPPERTAIVRNLASECGALVVFGSTVTTWSAYSLCLLAKEAGAKVVLLGRGETRADAIADVRVTGALSELCTSLAVEVCGVEVRDDIDKKQSALAAVAST
jgi:NAD-dependent SIR2 family protein deacetylase